MTGAHLTGWRLSAGDEHRVYDGTGNRIADVPCGGMSGRTFAEASECAALISVAPELAAMVERLRDALIQADLTIRSFPGADQSDVEFIREILDGPHPSSIREY